VDVSPLFIADTQPAELIHPGEGAFYDPAPSAQSAAMLGVPLGQEGLNMPFAQTLPDRLGVITAVAQHAIRSMAWTSPHSLQRWDGIDKR
jgi:hypothetical protein